MEVWKVLGFRKCDFKDANNRDVKGIKLFLYRAPDNPYVTGHEVVSFFVTDEKINFTPDLEQQISISFNRYGKISSVLPYYGEDNM